jgi:hypothetical protein
MDERTLDVQYICTCWIGNRSKGYPAQTIRLFCMMLCASKRYSTHFRAGQPAGYGFVEFATPYEAEQTLLGWNGRPVPNHPTGTT